MINYYGIWVSFADGSNAFWDPAKKILTTGHERGEKMPNAYFIPGNPDEPCQRPHEAMDDVEDIVERMEEHHGGRIRLHLTEIRPGDPDWLELWHHFNPEPI